MKKNEFIQIRGADLKELKLKVKSLRDDVANLALDKNMKKLKDLKVISKKKKELAQILTVIRQKELLTQLESRVESQESSEKILKPHFKEEKVTTKTKKPKEVAKKLKIRKEKTSS